MWSFILPERLTFELFSLTQESFADFLRDRTFQVAGDEDGKAFGTLMRQVSLVGFTGGVDRWHRVGPRNRWESVVAWGSLERLAYTGQPF